MKMNLKKYLDKNNIFLDLKSGSKETVIEEMIDRLVDSGKLKEKARPLQAIQAREQKMGTGMEHGIAIPHGKTDAVDHLVTAVGLKQEGIDFEAIDGKPSRIFIMTVSPLNRTGPHIQFLAEVSKLLKDDGTRKRLLAARTAEDVIRVFS